MEGFTEFFVIRNFKRSMKEFNIWIVVESVIIDVLNGCWKELELIFV